MVTDMLELSIMRTEVRLAALVTLSGPYNFDARKEREILAKLLKMKEDRKNGKS
jgi:hypothetical protein